MCWGGVECVWTVLWVIFSQLSETTYGVQRYDTRRFSVQEEARGCDGAGQACQWMRKPCQVHGMTDCPENAINCPFQSQMRDHLHTNSVPIWINDGWAHRYRLHHCSSWRTRPHGSRVAENCKERADWYKSYILPWEVIPTQLKNEFMLVRSQRAVITFLYWTNQRNVLGFYKLFLQIVYLSLSPPNCLVIQGGAQQNKQCDYLC